MFLDNSDTEFGSGSCTIGRGDNITSAEAKEVHRNPTYSGIIKAIVFELRAVESTQIGIFPTYSVARSQPTSSRFVAAHGSTGGAS